MPSCHVKRALFSSILILGLGACSAHHATDKQALNLVADSRDPRDDNGLFLNPSWKVQHQAGLQADQPFHVPDPEELCGGFPIWTQRTKSTGRPQCTTDATKIDQPDFWHKVICNLEPVGGLFKRKFRFGKFHGHVNWWPVTYEGVLTWKGRSGSYPFGDDDYNLELDPLLESEGDPTRLVRRRNGLTANRKTLHVEFHGDEVIRPFNDPAWTDLHRVFTGADGPERYAIVTGLFGLDAEHESYTELHPVYALAIRTGCARQPDAEGVYRDTWMIFVRNWGSEGFCSGWDTYHKLNLPQGVYTFRFRLPGATSAGFVEEETVFLADRDGGIGPHVELDPGPDGSRSAALVRFQLPIEDPGRPGIQRPSRLHGTLVLAWKGNPPADRCQLPPPLPEAVARLASLQDMPTPPSGTRESEDDPESFLESLAPSDEAQPFPPPPPPPPPPGATIVPVDAPSAGVLLRQGPLGEPLRDESPVVPGTIPAVPHAKNDQDEFFPPPDLQGLSDRELRKQCQEATSRPEPSDLDERERLQEKREYCQELQIARFQEKLIGRQREAHEKICAEAAKRKTTGLSPMDLKRLEYLRRDCEANR